MKIEIMHSVGEWLFLTKKVDKRDGKMIVAHYLPFYMISFFVTDS